MRVLLIPACSVIAHLLERLEKGLWLWRTGEYDVMVLTGGKGKYPNEIAHTYNNRMRDWTMSQQGHPTEAQLIIENQSCDTYSNIALSLERIRERGSITSITVVTQWQHGVRFRLTFKKAYGIHEVKVHNTEYKLPLFSWLLEWFYIFAYFIDPKGAWFLGPCIRWKRNRQ